MGRNENVSTSNAYNVLTAGTVLKGDINSEDNFRIDGNVEGNIVTKGKVIIGQSSIVTGNIECSNVELFGYMKGNIKCHGAVILRSSCNMHGEIKTRSIETEMNAKFFGTCAMMKDE